MIAFVVVSDFELIASLIICMPGLLCLKISTCTCIQIPKTMPTEMHTKRPSAFVYLHHQDRGDSNIAFRINIEKCRNRQ